jgi:hypothetical protein
MQSFQWVHAFPISSHQKTFAFNEKKWTDKKISFCMKKTGK